MINSFFLPGGILDPEEDEDTNGVEQSSFFLPPGVGVASMGGGEGWTSNRMSTTPPPSLSRPSLGQPILSNASLFSESDLPVQGAPMRYNVSDDSLLLSSFNAPPSPPPGLAIHSSAVEESDATFWSKSNESVGSRGAPIVSQLGFSSFHPSTVHVSDHVDRRVEEKNPLKTVTLFHSNNSKQELSLFANHVPENSTGASHSSEVVEIETRNTSSTTMPAPPPGFGTLDAPSTAPKQKNKIIHKQNSTSNRNRGPKMEQLQTQNNCVQADDEKNTFIAASKPHKERKQKGSKRKTSSKNQAKNSVEVTGNKSRMDQNQSSEQLNQNVGVDDAPLEQSILPCELGNGRTQEISDRIGATSCEKPISECIKDSDSADVSGKALSECLKDSDTSETSDILVNKSKDVEVEEVAKHPEPPTAASKTRFEILKKSSKTSTRSKQRNKTSVSSHRRDNETRSSSVSSGETRSDGDGLQRDMSGIVEVSFARALEPFEGLWKWVDEIFLPAVAQTLQHFSYLTKTLRVFGMIMYHIYLSAIHDVQSYDTGEQLSLLFFQIPLITDLLMSAFALPQFTPHIISHAILFYLCRPRKLISATSSESSVSSFRGFWVHKRRSRDQLSAGFARDLCRRTLRCLQVSIPFICIFDGFEKPQAAIMRLTQGERIVIFSLLRTLRESFLFEPIVLGAMVLQCILCRIPVSNSIFWELLVNQCSVAIGMASMRFARKRGEFGEGTEQ